jgi:hypothetical protein
MNEAAALPSPAVVLSARLKRYYGRIRRPPGRPSPSPPARVIGRQPPTTSQTAGPGRASPVPAATISNVPRPLRRRVPRGCTPGSAPLPCLRPEERGSALPCLPKRLSLRRGRLRLTLRTARSLPPKGLSTLRLDPGRFPPTPAARYRASWQLPGPDLPRQATTSLCTDHDIIDLRTLGAPPSRNTRSPPAGSRSPA